MNKPFIKDLNSAEQKKQDIRFIKRVQMNSYRYGYYIGLLEAKKIIIRTKHKELEASINDKIKAREEHEKRIKYID